MVLRIHTSHRTPESPTTRRPCGCSVARIASATSVLVQAPVVSTLPAAVAAKLASENRIDTKNRLRFMVAPYDQDCARKNTAREERLSNTLRMLGAFVSSRRCIGIHTKTRRREESMQNRLSGERSNECAAFVMNPPLNIE